MIAAGIYCRISLASLGDTTKTDDQERICRDLAARLEWPVVKVYVDPSRSAWQVNRKRPQWDQMIADIQAGTINAIVVYHGDRLLRTHDDLLTLIKLSRTRDLKLAGPTGVRDIGNGDDQFILEIEASMAKRESYALSRRRKQQYERWRREGRVMSAGTGGRRYGFETDGLTQIPAEAEVLREMCRRVLGGETAAAIARDLTRRGLRMPSGAPFAHYTVRRLLTRARYAGLMPDGISKAAWEPVLDRGDWETVCAVLDARGADVKTWATNERKYLLSGIAVCGACGAGLAVRWRYRYKGGPVVGAYACRVLGCSQVYRDLPLLDAYVGKRVTNRLSHPANPVPQVPESPGLASELVTLTGTRAELEALIRDHRGGHLPLLLARLESVDKRIGELRALAGDNARTRLLEEYAGISYEEFCGLPLSVRRSLVAACFDITVLPASKHGPGFRTEDVRLTPR